MFKEALCFSGGGQPGAPSTGEEAGSQSSHHGGWAAPVPPLIPGVSIADTGGWGWGQMPERSRTSPGMSLLPCEKASCWCLYPRVVKVDMRAVEAPACCRAQRRELLLSPSLLWMMLLPLLSSSSRLENPEGPLPRTPAFSAMLPLRTIGTISYHARAHPRDSASCHPHSCQQILPQVLGS